MLVEFDALGPVIEGPSYVDFLGRLLPIFGAKGQQRASLQIHRASGGLSKSGVGVDELLRQLDGLASEGGNEAYHLKV